MSIYLDYQATTPVDPDVMCEMLPYFSRTFANPHSADHSAGWEADAAVQAARAKISALIGCDADEIFFTSGATEANNLAILGLRRLISRDGRKKILSTAIEHKSVIDPCRVSAREYGAVVEICSVDNEGYLSQEEIESKLDESALLLSIGAANGEIGTLQRMEAVYAAASRCGVLVHFDAAQMPEASDLSKAAKYADMMSLSGHKMYGPKGVGCLYVRRELQDKIAPLMFGGGQQNGIRSGTLPVPLCVGMGAAAGIVARRTEARDDLRIKTRRLWQGIRSLGVDVALNGPSIDVRHPGNLNVCFPGYQADDILAALQPHLSASTGSACTSGTPEASYVLRAIGLTEDEARSSIRFSVGRETSEEEIFRAVDLLGDVLRRLDSVSLREFA